MNFPIGILALFFEQLNCTEPQALLKFEFIISSVSAIPSLVFICKDNEESVGFYKERKSHLKRGKLYCLSSLDFHQPAFAPFFFTLQQNTKWKQSILLETPVLPCCTPTVQDGTVKAKSFLKLILSQLSRGTTVHASPVACAHHKN